MSDRGSDWERVQDLFLEALTITGRERDGFLEERCGDDAELLEEVRSLLAAHEEGPIGVLDDESRWEGSIPEEIGDFRVVRPLGSGGMGTVLLAVRERHGFSQTAAVKLLSPGLFDRSLKARIREERRILARLEHPGVARFIDGGLTEHGQPYLAMEYVQGHEILDFCAFHRLPVRERVALFIEVCRAVQYLHQQLVVHRDLKPSNIMVTAAGQPKILDFGVAKVLEEEPGDAPRTGMWVTPAYASPEQLRGESPGTLSDVYSLGVILYELLTATRPYATRDKTPADLERIITSTTPMQPSARSLQTVDGKIRSPEERAGLFGSTPSKLRRALTGDLDTIVLRALAVEPHRRYASAGALAEDLQRYLDGLPVEARPDSLTYRVSRFVGRHRVAVGLSAVAAAAIIVGAGTAFTLAARARAEADAAQAERDRAEAESRRAQAVASLVTNMIRLSEPAAGGSDTVSTLRVLEEGADRVRSELSDDPALQATVLREVLGMYRNLGVLDRAEPLALDALQIERQLDPQGLGVRLSLADLADVALAMGDSDRAVDFYREALELVGESPSDTVSARIQNRLAWQLRGRGQGEEAARLFESALTVQDSLLGVDSPESADTRMGLASTYHDAGLFDRAETMFLEAIPEDLSTARPTPALASALANVGLLRRLRGEVPEAERFLQGALDLRLRMYGPSHPETLEATDEWGTELFALGRWREALEVLEDGTRRAAQVLPWDHPEMSDMEESFATVLAGMGQHDSAMAAQARVLANKRARLRADHPGIAYSLVAMGDMALEAGMNGRAREAYLTALDMVGPESNYGLQALRGLARWSRAMGRLDEAAERLADAEERASRALREGHRVRLGLARDRIELTLRTGRAEGTEEELQAILTGQQKIWPFPYPEVGRTWTVMGEARLLGGDEAGAAEAFTRALDLFAELPERHPWVVRAGEGLGRR